MQMSRNEFTRPRDRLRIALCIPMLLCAAVAAGGCASSAMTAKRSYVANEKIAKPGRIIVHEFAATPADLAPDSGVRDGYEKQTQTAEDVEVGRALAKIIATKLVQRLLAAGLPAERAGSGPPPSPGDIEITGEFLSIDEGNQARRVLIGFGAGAAGVNTLVELYQVTSNGRRRLASGEFSASGGKLPGMLVPVAGGAAAGRALTATAVSGGAAVLKETGPDSLTGLADKAADRIATQLETGARKQGWID